MWPKRSIIMILRLKLCSDLQSIALRHQSKDLLAVQTREHFGSMLSPLKLKHLARMGSVKL